MPSTRVHNMAKHKSLNVMLPVLHWVLKTENSTEEKERKASYLWIVLILWQELEINKFAFSKSSGGTIVSPMYKYVWLQVQVGKVKCNFINESSSFSYLHIVLNYWICLIW